MSRMKDYLIWCGEKMEKVMPGVSWETIMAMCTGELVPGFDVSKVPGYSHADYLKENTEGSNAK